MLKNLLKKLLGLLDDKNEVYCTNCKYFNELDYYISHDIETQYECNAPNNITFKECKDYKSFSTEKVHKRYPKDINKNNNCNWFKYA